MSVLKKLKSIESLFLYENEIQRFIPFYGIQ